MNRAFRGLPPIIRAFAGCLCVLADPLLLQAQGPAKVQAGAPNDAEIIAHLNAAVDWYHAVKASDTWLMQADDNFYKSSQDDLADHALASAFDYSQAMVAVVANQDTPSAKTAAGNSRAVRLATRAATNTEQLADLRDQEADITQRIASAQPADRTNLQAQGRLLEARIELESALGDTLGKVMAVVSNSGTSGAGQSLSQQVAALRRTLPGVFDATGSAAKKLPRPCEMCPTALPAARPR